MNPTDAQLLAAAKLERSMTPPLTGAFESILYKYEKLIHYIAHRYFCNREDALDASQEAALKIYNGLSRVEISQDGSLKPWICTVISRTCLDVIRKNRVKTVELTEEAIQNALPSAEETASGNERVKEVLDAINKLPDNYRMIIILRDMQGLSYDEMANVLDINVGTIKSRLSRARANLRKLVSDS